MALTGAFYDFIWIKPKTSKLKLIFRVQRLLEDEGYPTYGYLVQREPLIQEIPYQEFMKSPKKIPMLTGCTRYEMDHSPAPKPIGQALGFENPEEVYMKFRKDWDDEVYG